MMDHGFVFPQDRNASRPSALRPLRLSMPRSSHVQPTEHNFSSNIPKCPSLPSLLLPKVCPSSEPSFRNRMQDIKRPASVNNMRRSVSGMKRLLPLKLTSPPLPPSATWVSPVANTNPTMAEDTWSPSVQSTSFAQGQADKQDQLPVRTRQRRDTPVYTGNGSPLLTRIYDDEEDTCRSCSPALSCDETCIIDEYSSQGSESESAYTDCIDFFDEPDNIPTSFTPLPRSRHSELSFKCLGDTFFNEGAWLRSTSDSWTSSQPDCLPEILAQNMPGSIDIEGWISDSTGTSCEDSGDEDLSCATALAPAKAHVVDMNRNFDLNIIIPPRKSSLAQRGRKSRMVVRGDRGPMPPQQSAQLSDDDDLSPRYPSSERMGRSPAPRRQPDLAMASPPISPEFSPTSATTSSTTSRPEPLPELKRPISFLSHRVRSKSPQTASSTIFDVVEALNRSVSGFPSTMLLLDAPCIALIRKHIRQFPSDIDPASPLLSPFPTPAERRYNRSPLRHNNRTRERKAVLSYVPARPRSPSNHRLPRLDTNMNFISTNFASPLPSPVDSSEYRPSTSSTLSSNATSKTPSHNLQPLRTIFPKTSDFMRSALYAYILAYIFINSLSQPTSPHHLQLSSASIRSKVPSKAASTLGIPTGTPLPNAAADGFSTLVSKIEDGVSACIRKLVGGMEGRVGWSVEQGDGGRFLDRVFLRALVEVVKGCELRD
ncbi:hypothetical protein PVAG01_08450 [Phlyctema vagabunda]|uniref:Uncharacterized protein n=1 Tax=Phlyctema vagabunda TaxID=108571 RepID=A0ABR4P9F7_9HELO